MLKPIIGGLVLTMLVSANPDRAAADVSTDLLRELSSAAQCDKPRSVFRAWCPASLSRWKTGTAADLGRGERVLIGVTVVLRKGKSVRDALSNKVSVSALAIRHVGKKRFGLIATVTPNNKSERKMLAEAAFELALVLKGASNSAKLDKNLYGYLVSLPKAAKYPLVKRHHGWFMNATSSTELRRVGQFWVAVERPSSGPKGIFVSVFTDKHRAR